MKLKVKAAGVPVGAYYARFMGVEETEHEEYGAGLLWKLEVVSGDCAGQIAGRVTGPEPTLKNGCGKMLSAIIGRPVIDKEEVDLAPYIGQVYWIVVAETKNGTTRVESAIAAPATPAAPPAPVAPAPACPPAAPVAPAPPAAPPSAWTPPATPPASPPAAA